MAEGKRVSLSQVGKAAANLADVAATRTVSRWDRVVGVLLAVPRWLLRPIAGNLDIFRVNAISLLLGLVVIAAVWPAQSVEPMYVVAENASAGAPGQAIALGIALTVASLSAWYWARILLYLLIPWDARWDARPDAFMWRRFWWEWLPRIAAMLPVVGVALALLRAGLLPVALATKRPSGSLFLLFAYAVLQGLGFLAVLRQRMALVRQLRKEKFASYREAIPDHRVRNLRPWSKVLIGLSTVAFVVAFLAVFLSDGQIARPFGVAAVLLFATATWIPIASWVLLLGIQHN